MSENVPSFRKPPVIEVVWSVQFDESLSLGTPHVGLFWERIRKDYPTFEEKPPIPHAVERSDCFSPIQSSAQLLTEFPINRQWFLSPTGNELIQLQRDRLCVNWRRKAPDDEYPRYSRMKTLFADAWHSFRTLTGDLGLNPMVNQCEMTYVNHLVRGEGWEIPKDIETLFPAFRWGDNARSLPHPSSVSTRLLFDIEGVHGRLHVTLRHGKSQVPEPAEFFVLELTARGLPMDPTDSGIGEWFVKARHWIVNGFADLTSERAHALWEREQ